MQATFGSIKSGSATISATPLQRECIAFIDIQLREIHTTHYTVNSTQGSLKLLKMNQAKLKTRITENEGKVAAKKSTFDGRDD